MTVRASASVFGLFPGCSFLSKDKLYAQASICGAKMIVFQLSDNEYEKYVRSVVIAISRFDNDTAIFPFLRANTKAAVNLNKSNVRPVKSGSSARRSADTMIENVRPERSTASTAK